MKTTCRIISTLFIGSFLAAASYILYTAIQNSAICDNTQDAMEKVDSDIDKANTVLRKIEAQRQAEAKWRAEQIERINRERP